MLGSTEPFAIEAGGLTEVSVLAFVSGPRSRDARSETARSSAQPREPLERLLVPLSPLQRDILVRRIIEGHSATRVARDLSLSLAEARAIQRGALRRILPSAH